MVLVNDTNVLRSVSQFANSNTDKIIKTIIVPNTVKHEEYSSTTTIPIVVLKEEDFKKLPKYDINSEFGIFFFNVICK
jgi:hypothetical protein